MFRFRVMRAIRVLIALAVLFSVVLQSADAARADCAELPPLDEAIAEASSVFIGVVLDAGFDSGQATIRVQWIWKGRDLAEEVTVSTPVEATARQEEGFQFRAGSTYIVIVEEAGSEIEIGACSGTRTYRGDGESVPAELQEAAGTATGRAPGGAKSAEANEQRISRLLLLAIVAAIAVGFLVWRRARRTADGSSSQHRPKRMRKSRGRSADKRIRRMRRRR